MASPHVISQSHITLHVHPIWSCIFGIPPCISLGSHPNRSCAHSSSNLSAAVAYLRNVYSPSAYPLARNAAHDTFLANTDLSRYGTVSKMTKYVTGNVLKRKNHPEPLGCRARMVRYPCNGASFRSPYSTSTADHSTFHFPLVNGGEVGGGSDGGASNWHVRIAGSASLFEGPDPNISTLRPGSVSERSTTWNRSGRARSSRKKAPTKPSRSFRTAPNMYARVSSSAQTT